MTESQKAIAGLSHNICIEKSIRIGNKALLCGNVIITAGVTIDEDAVISKS